MRQKREGEGERVTEKEGKSDRTEKEGERERGRKREREREIKKEKGEEYTTVSTEGALAHIVVWELQDRVKALEAEKKSLESKLEGFASASKDQRESRDHHGREESSCSCELANKTSNVYVCSSFWLGHS